MKPVLNRLKFRDGKIVRKTKRFIRFAKQCKEEIEHKCQRCGSVTENRDLWIIFNQPDWLIKTNILTMDDLDIWCRDCAIEVDVFAQG